MLRLQSHRAARDHCTTRWSSCIIILPTSLRHLFLLPPRWCSALLTHSWWFWQAQPHTCESCRSSSTWLTHWWTEKLKTSCPHHTAICRFLLNWLMSALIGMWVELPSILLLYVLNYICTIWAPQQQQQMQLKHSQAALDVLKPSVKRVTHNAHLLTWLRNKTGHKSYSCFGSCTVEPRWHLLHWSDLWHRESSLRSCIWRCVAFTCLRK